MENVLRAENLLLEVKFFPHPFRPEDSPQSLKMVHCDVVGLDTARRCALASDLSQHWND